MSREIKFRTRLENKREMIPGGIGMSVVAVPAGAIINDSLVVRYNMVTMQYTGIKDKEGAELYEGDIIEEENSGYTNGKLLHEVKRMSRYNGRGVDSIITKDPLLPNTMGTFTIVGNIYQNPELLA